MFDESLDEEVKLKAGLRESEKMDSLVTPVRSKVVEERGTNISALLYPFLPNISLFLYKQRSVHVWVYEILQNKQL